MKWLLPAIGCALLAIGAGCQNSSQSSGSSASAEGVTIRHAKKLGPTDIVVKHTHLPINYVIANHRIVRINDVTTGLQLWAQVVPNNTHLFISTNGIRINNSWVYSGSLKKGDVYEVVLVRPNGF
jgi:hypothetical protein